MTAATRALDTAHTEGKQKETALQAAIERAGIVAGSRGESLTDALKTQIEKRADSIWAKK